MSLPIIWSPQARISYLDILSYLKEEWSQKEVEKFYSYVETNLNFISRFPMLYQYSPISDTHKCVLTKQISMFYKVKDQEIEVLVFWDNRQDPDVLDLIL